MHQSVKPQLPVYDDGQLDLSRVSEMLGTKHDVLADILDVSVSTIRAPRVSPNVLKKAQNLLHILNMLWDLTGGKEREVSRWLNEPRVEWKGLTPIDCLRLGKVKAVKELLEGFIEGEVSGT